MQNPTFCSEIGSHLANFHHQVCAHMQSSKCNHYDHYYMIMYASIVETLVEHEKSVKPSLLSSDFNI